MSTRIFRRIQSYLLKRRSREALALLAKNEEQIGVYDANGTTHLHTAVFKRLSDVTTFLVENGCDVNFADIEGNTALTIVMKTRPFPDDFWYINYLTLYGANLSHKNKAGSNALAIFERKCPDERIRECLLNVITACELSDLDVAALLYDAGWLIYHVIKLDRLEVMSHMIKMGADVNARERVMNDTALHLAVNMNKVEYVTRLLFQHGADVNVRNKYGWSPLSCALLYNRRETHLEVLQALLRKNPQCSAYDIFDALSNSTPQVVNLMLNYAEFDLTMTNEDGESALHFAAGNPCPNVMNILVEKNAVIDWDQRTHRQKNALHYAAECGNFSVIEFLIEKGTKVQAKDQTGCQPLIYAILSRTECNNNNNDSHALLKKQLLATFELLLNHGSDIDAIVNEPIMGFVGTPLYATRSHDDDEMANRLLEKIALREFMGIPTSECNRGIIESTPTLNLYLNMCKLELVTMVACDVHNGVSMLEILNGETKDFQEWIGDIQKREAFSQRFEEFPIYGKQLKERFWKMNSQRWLSRFRRASTR